MTPTGELATSPVGVATIMQTIVLHLYSFEELAPQVQQQVIERERSINVDDGYWYEPIIEEWTEELQHRGFEQVEILFTGFGSQGDGACFTATVNLETFLRACGLEKRFPQVIDAATRALLGVSIRHTYRYSGFV